MRLHWVTPTQEITGNALGYSLMRQRFHEGLLKQGCQFDDGVDLALHMIEPGRFKPIRGKRNVLLTMWESEVLDKKRIHALAQADKIITPSKFCQDIFRKYVRTPIEVVPLGVDLEAFHYRERKLTMPFTWLWVGAPNARKGWDVIQQVWTRVFQNTYGARLYMKTTGTGRDTIDTVGNVVVDSRRLSTEALEQLYHSAHGFIFPTAGEGFGLTALEAMATGLPCVVTDYSGVKDFTDRDSVYYVGFDWDSAMTSEGQTVRTAYARPVEVARAMRDVMMNYTKALRVGRKAHRKARWYTWERASRRLTEALT